MNTNEQRAYDAINRYQLEQRKAQLLWQEEACICRGQVCRWMRGGESRKQRQGWRLIQVCDCHHVACMYKMQMRPS